MYFGRIENLAYGKINERSFSNPHPSNILGRLLGPSGVSPNQRSRWKHAFSPL